MTETVIVTGAAGFIGSHLSARLLDSGLAVLGIDNLDPYYDLSIKRRNLQRLARERGLTPFHSGGQTPLPRDRFSFLQADIRDASAMREACLRARPACVVHLAALAGVRPSIREPLEYVSVNIDGLVSVLEAARASGCRRFVFASSSSVYGDNPKVPFAETDPVDSPISPYAATKRAGELICQTYAVVYGLRLASLRFFTVYGPDQRPDLAIAKFMRATADHADLPMFGDGSMSRDYSYIDDVIDGVLAADRLLAGPMGACPAGELPGGGFHRAWNLGSAHSIRLDELIERLAVIAGRTPRISAAPTPPGDVQQTWADLSRSAAELGYQTRVSLDEGLRRQWNAMS